MPAFLLARSNQQVKVEVGIQETREMKPGGMRVGTGGTSRKKRKQRARQQVHMMRSSNEIDLIVP
jgi:hypothetical protein